MPTKNELFSVSIQAIVDNDDLPWLLVLQERVRKIYNATLSEVSSSVRASEKINIVQNELDAVQRAVKFLAKSADIH